MIGEDFSSGYVNGTGSSFPMAKRGVEKEYEEVISVLQKFSATSLIDQCLEVLWFKAKNPLDNLRAAPWLTLLLIKWALQNPRINLRIGKDIPLEVLDEIRQYLWNIQGRPSPDVPGKNMHLILRKIIYSQVEFQRPPSWDFMRWPSLIARLDKNHVSYRCFVEVIGLEPLVFVDLSFYLHSAIYGERVPFNKEWFNPLRGEYGIDVDKFLNIFSRDIIELRDELLKVDAQRIRGKGEFFEFPYLRKFPLVKMRNGEYHCWHPLVFARGMDDAVHVRLSERGQEYTDSFSRVFEEYVTELAVESGMATLVESDYKNMVRERERDFGEPFSSVEVIFDGEDCNVFVEAKMSLFPDDVLVSDNEEAIYKKTKHIRRAIAQGWRVGEIVRSEVEVFGDRFLRAQDFLLIVTSRELIVGSGDKLKKIYKEGVFEYPDESARERLPLGNVFMLTIQDFERLTMSIKYEGLNLLSFLKAATQANSDPHTSRMFFNDFFEPACEKSLMPLLLVHAIKGVEDRMEIVLAEK